MHLSDILFFLKNPTFFYIYYQTLIASNENIAFGPQYATKILLQYKHMYLFMALLVPHSYCHQYQVYRERKVLSPNTYLNACSVISLLPQRPFFIVSTKLTQVTSNYLEMINPHTFYISRAGKTLGTCFSTLYLYCR